MTREEAANNALSKVLLVKSTILYLGTGYGKSKLAIDCINKIADFNFKQNEEETTVSIIVPRQPLINNWKEEIKKWGCNTDKIEILCYNSIHKLNKYCNCIVFDEAHHLSELKREILNDIFKVNPNVKLLFLSATIPHDIMDYMKSLGTYNIVKGNIADGIKDEVLPTPIIYTIPLYLDNIKSVAEIIKNPRCSNPVTCNYDERWNFIKRFTTRKIIIKCTQKQYYNELSDKIDWYKRKFMFNKTVVFKNKWLRAASERLKWLSEQKVDICQSIISILQDQRVLLFCNNIEQSLKFKNYAPINSKNKNSLQNLDDFNNSKINHISSVNMLSEGMNLTNCRVGLFCNLNASEILSQQKFGRLLRHPKPIVIIPYFKDTRDEELKDKMLKDYDSSMIKEITDIKDIKL